MPQININTREREEKHTRNFILVPPTIESSLVLLTFQEISSLSQLITIAQTPCLGLRCPSLQLRNSLPKLLSLGLPSSSTTYNRLLLTSP
jgi:hypothetical protein